MPFLTDSSTNNFSLTAFGNAAINTTTFKYGGGSVYFDGNGDYLQANWNDGFTFGTGDFTVEFWVYPLTTPSGLGFICSDYNPGSIGNVSWALGAASSLGAAAGSNLFFGSYEGSWTGIQSSTSLSLNAWSHVVASRSSGTLRLFLNGTNIGEGSFTNNIQPGDPLIIGRRWDFNSTNSLNGYIDDIRVTKGIARYTSNFIPPSYQLPDPSDPYLSNVSLLLHMDGLSGSQTFTDSSLSATTLSAFGNAQISTSVKKFGNGSAYFDGSGDYLRLNGSNAFAFSTNDFTVEFWAYVSDWSSRNIYESRGLGEEGNRVTIYVNNNTFIFYNAGDRITSDSKNSNQWYHVAVCRALGITRMFIDGVQEGSNYTDTTNYGIGVNRPLVGAYEEVRADGYFNGYIDEVRVTKGVARYTSNFVPQTAPFVSAPILVPSGYLAFWKLDDTTDSSSNANTLTNNGSVTFVAGKVGNCAQFTGSNGVYLQDNSLTPAFNPNGPSGEFTISCWVYPQSFSNYQAFLGSTSNGFIIHTDAGGTIYCNEAGSGDASIPGYLQLNQWQHIVFVKSIVSGNRSKIYYNGTKVYDQPTNNINNYQSKTNITLGNYGGLSFPYNGRLDMVGLWNRELSQAEIDQLYNGGLGAEP